jgi:hypothetical protein
VICSTRSETTRTYRHAIVTFRLPQALGQVVLNGLVGRIPAEGRLECLDRVLAIPEPLDRVCQPQLRSAVAEQGQSTVFEESKLR